MRKLFATTLAAIMALGISAQDNMEAFKHLSVGVEAGLHGIGFEVAMPVQKHLVLKAGYNFLPSGDLFNTNFNIDTKDLKKAQEDIEKIPGQHFNNKFGDEAVINAGLQVGVSNLKLILNYYPFESSSFYVAGGFYYSLNDKPFISISGNTTENDWAALQELRDKGGEDSYDIALEIGDKKYPVIEKDGCGYLQADYKFDPLKYYVGLGFGRSIPNKRVGFQFELGTMFYTNAKFYCQDQEVSMSDAADKFGDAAKTAVDFMDKFPIYPQLAFRLNFLAF